MKQVAFPIKKGDNSKRKCLAQNRTHQEVAMNGNLSSKTGIELLLKKCREKFRIPENLNHYSAEDYRIAERKFIKYSLQEGA